MGKRFIPKPTSSTSRTSRHIQSLHRACRSFYPPPRLPPIATVTLRPESSCRPVIWTSRAAPRTPDEASAWGSTRGKHQSAFDPPLQPLKPPPRLHIHHNPQFNSGQDLAALRKASCTSDPLESTSFFSPGKYNTIPSQIASGAGNPPYDRTGSLDSVFGPVPAFPFRTATCCKKERSSLKRPIHALLSPQ